MAEKIAPPKNCEECIKKGLNKLMTEDRGVKHCPYEFLQYVKKTVDFFKKEFDLDVAQLQQLIPVIDEKTKACLAQMSSEVEKQNAELARLERLRQQLGITDFMQSIEQLRNELESVGEAVHKLCKTNEMLVKHHLSGGNQVVVNPVDVESSDDDVEMEEKVETEKARRWRALVRNIKKKNIDRKIEEFLSQNKQLSRDDIKVFKNKAGNYTIMYDRAKLL